MDKDIENAARKYLGVPWKHQGRNEYGLDCVGLGILVAHDLQYTNFDFTNYKMDPDPIIMRYYLNQNLVRVRHFKFRKAGDFFYMCFYKHPQHLAIYTSDNTIIHSAAIFGGVVEHSLDDYWKNRIKEVYRFRR